MQKIKRFRIALLPLILAMFACIVDYIKAEQMTQEYKKQKIFTTLAWQEIFFKNQYLLSRGFIQQSISCRERKFSLSLNFSDKVVFYLYHWKNSLLESGKTTETDIGSEVITRVTKKFSVIVGFNSYQILGNQTQQIPKYDLLEWYIGGKFNLLNPEKNHKLLRHVSLGATFYDDVSRDIQLDNGYKGQILEFRIDSGLTFWRLSFNGSVTSVFNREYFTNYTNFKLSGMRFDLDISFNPHIIEGFLIKLAFCYFYPTTEKFREILANSPYVIAFGTEINISK